MKLFTYFKMVAVAAGVLGILSPFIGIGYLQGVLFALPAGYAIGDILDDYMKYREGKK